MARPARIALVGFGHVGRRFASLLGGAYAKALDERGFRVVVVGIATARHGIAINPRGLPLRQCLALVRSSSLASLHRGRRVESVLDFIARVPADILVEITPLDPRRGEPAIRHVRSGLERGLDVVTANKGPVAFAYRRLSNLAKKRGAIFRHEGAVLDGVPVFNLVERCLPGNRIDGFRGALNSTSSHVLSRIAKGATLEAAVREAQAQGIAEADPRYDLLGWDSAVKGCALANVLMGAHLVPARVRRKGILSLSPARIRSDARKGIQWRLVVRGRRAGRGVRVSVGPEALGPGDPLAGEGADTTLILETRLLGEIGILEKGGDVDQTAYALLSDIVSILELRKRP